MRRVLPLVLGFLAAPAAAQTGRFLPALESLAAVADRAFTGRVVAVARTEFRNAAEGPDHREFLPLGMALYRFDLTVRVERDLRGRGEGTVHLSFEAQGGGEFETAWIDRSKSYLWSLIPTARVEGGSLGYDILNHRVVGSAGGWVVLDLDHAKDDEDYGHDGRFHLPLFAESMAVVRTREDALAHLARFIRDHPGPLPLVQATVPHDVATRSGIAPNAYLVVAFPKDPVAETATRGFGKRPR